MKKTDPCLWQFDHHLIILILIMIIIGAFGGYLNYLHNFDTVEDQTKKSVEKCKYILLGIGAAFLVPAFLKMIASDLIKSSVDNINYLIFAGFCLVASIFSRRFITTIGDRILEAAKNAEVSSKEAKKEVESARMELSNTTERVEDFKVKLAVNLKNNTENEAAKTSAPIPQQLIELAENYEKKTSIPNYYERVKLKGELGRSMGQIILANNLSKEELIKRYKNEGMYLAVAYSIEFKPDSDSLLILNKIAPLVTQLYTKYVISIAYKTLASSRLISNEEAITVKGILDKLRVNADRPLITSIDETITALKLINPTM